MSVIRFPRRHGSPFGSSRLAGFLLLVLLAAAGPGVARAQSRVYQWTDERGVVHFSDSNVPEQFLGRSEVRAYGPGPTPSAAEPGPFRVPLVSRDGKKFARVMLEGRRGRREVLMLVDTGAQISMIDETLAGQLALEFVSEAGIVGVTGVAPGWIGRVRRLGLAERDLRDWPVMVGPLPGMYLLGIDVLERLRLDVGADRLEQR